MLELRAPAIQDWLAEKLADELADIGVPVSLGYPIGGPDACHVWIVGAFEADFSRRTSGGAMREETGSATVKVLATSRCDDVSPVRDRVAEIVDLVEAAVSSDPTMGDLVHRAELTSVKGTEGVTKDVERQFGVDLSISYHAFTTEGA